MAAVQQGATDDITALVTNHAAEAARRTSERWSDDPDGALLVAAHPELWSCTPELEVATRNAVDAWIDFDRPAMWPSAGPSDAAPPGSRRWA